MAAKLRVWWAFHRRFPDENEQDVFVMSVMQDMAQLQGQPSIARELREQHDEMCRGDSGPFVVVA